MKINETGRSMIEMLGVLAVIGVLSVGGFSLISKMQNSYTINQVVDTAGDLASRTRIVMRDYEGNKGSSMNKFLCKAKAIPDSLRENMVTCSDDAFSGIGDVEYNIYYTYGSENSAATFVLQIKNVSEEMCMQIVTTNWGGPGSSGFLGMSVGDSYDSILTATASEKVALVGSTSHPAPMGIGAAATACEDGKNINMAYR